MELFEKFRNVFIKKEIDIYTCFKPMIFVFRFMGTLPYSFSYKNELQIFQFESWLSFIAYQSAALFLLITWIFKLDTNQLVQNPFMLLSFIRSIAYYIFICLYTFKVKSNHEKSVKIFRKIKKINSMVSFKEKFLKRFFIHQLFGGIISAIVFPTVLYFFLADANNLQEFFNNFSLVMTLALPNMTEAVTCNIIIVAMMYLDETLVQLKKLSRNISKSSHLKFL